MPYASIELLRGGAVVKVIEVDSVPITIGRALSNLLILNDEDVSAHHAVIAVVSDGLFVDDLNSTNGTFVDDQAIRGRTGLSDGSLVRLGDTATLRVKMTQRVSLPSLLLEDETAGVTHVIDSERVYLGGSQGDHVVLPCCEGRAATLIVHANNEVWLGTEEDDRPLAIGEWFEICDHRFRLREVPSRPRATFKGREPTRYPYSLTASLDAPGGPVATLQWSARSLSYSITASNRATLLYVLGRAVIDDKKANRLPAETGWVDDDDLVVAIWGRKGFEKAISSLSVLVHRARKEIDGAGFDPWFIEKRRGATRIRLDEIDLR